jgi:hypothetical protein
MPKEAVRQREVCEEESRMKASELKQAFRDCRIEPGCAVRLSNGWFVVAEKIYPQPARPGPAWHLIYKVKSPTGKTFGGMARIDSMVSHFANEFAFQWRDDYHANGYGRMEKEPV